MTITTNLQLFSKYANAVQVGPINGTANGSYAEGKAVGAVWYIGEDQDNNVITDSPTNNALNNSFVLNDNNYLNDFSLYVSSPQQQTTLEISMAQLYDAIGIAMNGNDTGDGIAQPTADNPISINFGAVDVVGNGQIGKMIILGSDLIPLADAPADG